jgi:FMN phosphatase YigB (HAD superfamily)
MVEGVKALAFDTGGTILDWHSGVRDALARAASRSKLWQATMTISEGFSASHLAAGPQAQCGLRRGGG